MNGPERRAFGLILFLFATGLLARHIPQNLIQPLELVDTGTGAVWTDPVTSTPSPLVSEPSATNAKKGASTQNPVRINHAGLAELVTIKGIGPALAKRIVAYREAHGPLQGPTELDKIPGIGVKKMKIILPFVIFD